jgi:hypothetical protein
MANTVGKISGQVLESNLIRQGEDLAFETDLIYLNVNTQRVGINTDIPFRPLVVDGTLSATQFLVDTQLSVPNFLFSGNTILNDSDDITISATGLGSAVVASAVSTDSILINTSGIQSLRSNEDIDLTPNGLGQTVFNSMVDVDGNLHVTGNITFDGSIVIGNNDTDNFILNADLSSDLIPNITDTYALGSQSKQWDTLSTVLVNGATLSSGGAVVGGIDISTRAGNIWYVAANGNDSNVGDHPNGPFSTIEWALGQATSGDTVYVYPGTYYTKERISNFHTEYGISSLALLDTANILVELMNAEVMPQTIVTDGEGRVVYNGAIDDRIQDLGEKRQVVTQRYLGAVLDSLAAGSPVPFATTIAHGCYIEREIN